MNSLSLWNPLRELEALMPLRYATWPAALEATPWAPVVDIEETQSDYLIRAELPGVDKARVQLVESRGVLTLSGDRTIERTAQGKSFHRMERVQGAFSRRFVLPEDADREALKASYKDGVLEVRVPKRRDARPQEVKIEVE